MWFGIAVPYLSHTLNFSLLEGAVLSYLLPMFVYFYFSNVPLFLRNHSTASQYFLQILLLHSVTSLKKLFTAPSLLLRGILRYFGAHFGVYSSIFESCSSSYSEQMFSVLLSQSVYKETFHCLHSCAGGIMQYFGLILGILHNVLRNLKHSIDILHVLILLWWSLN